MHARQPIGVFDSGVGGLSVWREIARQLPYEDTVYFADQAHIPYGPRPPEEIRRYAEAITRFLLRQGCKAIVVACNTASAAALKYLRETFPDVPFIGMEPAVKPAAAQTRTRVVGVMATPATLFGSLFATTAERHANDVKLVNQTCPGLVEQIERGALDSPETEAMLRGFLQPILAANADTIVLACTHYPFVMDTIRRLAGPGVHVIDPAPAIARQTARVLTDSHLSGPHHEGGTHTFHTTGNAAALRRSLSKLVGKGVDAAVSTTAWEGGELYARETEGSG